jgi:hypothetical protein
VHSSDIVDVLLDQHDRIRQLCAVVEHSDGAARKRHFTELSRLVRVHELADRRIVHPAARNANPAGDAIGVACMTEEDQINQAFTGMAALGVGHGTFDVRFAAAHAAVLHHAQHEERDEFPLLRRYVGTQRLHMMASELHDMQAMVD